MRTGKCSVFLRTATSAWQSALGTDGLLSFEPRRRWHRSDARGARFGPRVRDMILGILKSEVPAREIVIGALLQCLRMHSPIAATQTQFFTGQKWQTSS